jgi:type IV pilus assembly protein PilA
MARRLRSRHGFTLMELMIVVAIMGILAAIAVPTFIMLMNRSKTGEAAMNLNNMFKYAAAYYGQERAGRTGSVSTNCIVGDGGPDPSPPQRFKQKMRGDDPNFMVLGFTVADEVYFSYAMAANPADGRCGVIAGEMSVYTFMAKGDLDGDGIYSTFEMATGTDDSNTLYHAIGFYIDNELE